MTTETNPVQPLSLRQNMLWNAFGSLCNMGCQWLMTVVIVRMSDNFIDAGLFALAMSVYGIFLPIAQYRMYIYQISDTKGEYTTGEYLAFRIITCALSLLLCMVYAVITCSWDALAPIALYGLYKASGQVIDVLHASDQVGGRMDYIGKSLALQGFGAFACFVIIFMLTKNLNVTLASMSVAVILVGVFYDRRKTRTIADIHFGITCAKTRTLLITCLPVVLGSIAFSAAPQLPKQFLFAMSGDSALGIYASVAAPIAIIQMGASYVYYPFLTYLTNYYAEGNKAQFVKLIAQSTLGIAALGIVCAILLEFFAVPLLVFMYGDEIAGYGFLVQPLLVSAILMGFTWFLNDLLIALRNFRAVLIASICELLVALALAYPFIQFFSMNGVTFDTIAACLASLTAMLILMVKQCRIQFQRNSVDCADGADLPKQHFE